MSGIDRITGATALASGATGFALALPLGATLQGAGGLAQAAVPLALLGGAVAVLLKPRKAAGEDTAYLRPRPGAYPATAEAPALTPEAWLGRIGAMALPREGRAAAIDEALRRQMPGGDLATDLLLVGLAACGSPEAGVDGPAFLRDLSAAMRLDHAQRTKALGAMAGRAPATPALPHAFAETRLLAAFEAARERAGIASAAFAWLRFHRREAWYALNSLGRPAPYVEGALPLSHYGQELKEGAPRARIETGPVTETLMALCDRIEAGKAA